MEKKICGIFFTSSFVKGKQDNVGFGAFLSGRTDGKQIKCIIYLLIRKFGDKQVFFYRRSD